jgi:hypothetical protein
LTSLGMWSSSTKKGIGMRFIPAGSKVVAILLLLGSLPVVAPAEELDARELIERMSAAIDGLDSYRVDGDHYRDARLPAGLIIEHPSGVTVRVRRPGAIRLTNRTIEDTKEIFFSETSFTVFSESKGYYAQTEIDPGIESALDYAIDELGIDAPLLDFLVSDVAGNLLAGAEEVDYLGTALIRGRVHHQVVIRQPEIDVQLWIANEGPPLPGKMSISSKWQGGAPRFVIFMNWDLDPDIPEGKLVFEPPEGATQIPILEAPFE